MKQSLVNESRKMEENVLQEKKTKRNRSLTMVIVSGQTITVSSSHYPYEIPKE